MIYISGTTETLEVTTSTAATVDYIISYSDVDATSATPGTDQGQITTATTTTILAAPGSGLVRAIKSLTLYAVSGTVDVTVKKDISGTERVFVKRSLSAGETLQYEDGSAFSKLAVDRTGDAGRLYYFYKTGTGADTIGYHYFYSKDTGFPGAWAVGTPGLSGRTTNGTSSTDAGCIPIQNPSSGANYITKFELGSSVAHFFTLFDVLWVNSGTVVTTTTAQTINSVTLPARDINGTTNGEGCMIGLLFTGASTNAAVINNSTVGYTNSGGTNTRTATLSSLVGAQIPATPVAGTVVWFSLQAGDTGVQSIQSLTLGTSLVTGSVSLIIARPIATASVTLANAGSTIAALPVATTPGIRIFDNTCAFIGYQSSATTATTISGSIVANQRT